MSAASSSRGTARGHGETVGRVAHYYANAGAAVIELTRGALAVGDSVYVHGHTTDFVQRVDSLQCEDEAVERAEAPTSVGLKLDQPARTGDRVDRITPTGDANHAT